MAAREREQAEQRDEARRDGDGRVDDGQRGRRERVAQRGRRREDAERDEDRGAEPAASRAEDAGRPRQDERDATTATLRASLLFVPNRLTITSLAPGGCRLITSDPIEVTSEGAPATVPATSSATAIATPAASAPATAGRQVAASSRPRTRPSADWSLVAASVLHDGHRLTVRRPLRQDWPAQGWRPLAGRARVSPPCPQRVP